MSLFITLEKLKNGPWFCIYFQDRERTEGSLGGFEVSAIVGGVLLVAVLSLTLTKKYRSVYWILYRILTSYKAYYIYVTNELSYGSQ